jgi:hypothetical protein
LGAFSFLDFLLEVSVVEELEELAELEELDSVVDSEAAVAVADLVAEAVEAVAFLDLRFLGAPVATVGAAIIAGPLAICARAVVRRVFNSLTCRVKRPTV